MRFKFSTFGNFIANHAVLYYRNLQKVYRKLYTEQHQLTSTTAQNRYPELFTEARRYANNFSYPKNLSILSYGCSTGEECVSLKKYFLEARIIGADINKSNIAKATKINSLPGISYIFSSEENIVNEGKYDLIFCLSVLCRWEDTKDVHNCEAIYPFERFEKTTNMLTNQLQVGGMIVIYNANFRFEDTAAGSAFEILQTPSVSDSGFVHKFDSQNNRLTEPHGNCVYRKIKE